MRTGTFHTAVFGTWGSSWTALHGERLTTYFLSLVGAVVEEGGLCECNVVDNFEDVGEVIVVVAVVDDHLDELFAVVLRIELFQEVPAQL